MQRKLLSILTPFLGAFVILISWIQLAQAMTGSFDPQQEKALVSSKGEVASQPITVTKTDDRSVVHVGDQITYHLVLTNENAGDNTSIILTDTLPEEVTFVSASENGHYISTTHVVMWSLVLASSESIEVVLRVTVEMPQDMLTGTRLLTNTVEACFEATCVSAEDTDDFDIPIQGLALSSDAPTVVGWATHYTTTLTSGTNVSYTWNFGDGSPGLDSGTNATATYTYALPGLYTAIVTATNTVTEVTKTLAVEIVNHPPVADAGDDQTALVNQTVTLDGSGAFDPDEHPLTYAWFQTGGPLVTLTPTNKPTATFTAPITPTVLTFTLQVIDMYGLSATDQIVITVEKATLYLPVIIRSLPPFPNGHFDQGLSYWAFSHGPFSDNGQENGTGLPDPEVVDGRALLGITNENTNYTDGSNLPVGYVTLSQAFTVQQPYLSFTYDFYSFDGPYGLSSGKYYDTVDLSINAAPTQITDEMRNTVCKTEQGEPPWKPDGTISVDQDGLMACLGATLGRGKPTVFQTGPVTLTLDLSAYLNTNVTLYITLWSREYDSPYTQDKAYYRTWLYLDDFVFSSSAQ